MVVASIHQIIPHIFLQYISLISYETSLFISSVSEGSECCLWYSHGL